jgi:hypothetical protein
MLKCLYALAEDSIVIFDNTSLINFNKLSNKITLLFVSSEFAKTMESKPKQTKAIFILEDDKNKVDQRERFGTGEDLIYQLADEVYRCYKKEASDDFKSGNLWMAEKKGKQADGIHSELWKVQERYLATNKTTKASACAAKTIIVWLKSQSQDNTEVEKVYELFSKVVSSFLVFDSHLDCHKYLLKNERDNAVFLIISNDYENWIVSDFQQLSNVKEAYHYGQSSSKNETIINNCHDLCVRLTHDLMVHYNRLGSDCSVEQDTKTASDMYMKAHELCNIFAKI